jgi:hypothetical protein
MFPMSPAESWAFLFLIFTVMFTGPKLLKNFVDFICERARQRQLEEYYNSKR